MHLTGPVALDIVIPMYNEAEVLPALLETLAETFTPAVRDRLHVRSIRCLFVDDGSTDDSVAIVRRARIPGIGIRVIQLSRNFGHQAAVTAGIAYSGGDLVAIIDADLQDPPWVILEMIVKWRDGAEVVYAQRRNRKEGAPKRVLYWAFYRLYRLLSPITVPVDSGDFCLMSRRVVKELNALPESVRFPRGLRSWVGFRQTAVEYDRPARQAGDTHYAWGDLYKLATDGIASLSLRPLKVAQFLALVYIGLSGFTLVGLFFGGFERLSVRFQLSALFAFVVVSNALLLLCLYILGAYLGRAYLEVKGRPPYIVADVLDGEETGGE